MLLGDKISMLRKKRGWSQEELAEKMNVSRQAVSKWESSTSIPDLEKIVKLSQLFGVSVDFLVKEEWNWEHLNEEESLFSPEEEQCKVLELEEAAAFVKVALKGAKRRALALLLLLVSMIPLITLTILAAGNCIAWNEQKASLVGVLVGTVGVGVLIGLEAYTKYTFKPYCWLGTSIFRPSYGVEGMAKKEQEKYESMYHLGKTGGILFLLGSISLLIVTQELKISTEGKALGAAMTLLLAAFGVAILVYGKNRYKIYQNLLQQGCFSKETKMMERRNAGKKKIYWTVVTAIYLILILGAEQYDHSWVIWVVAAVLYPALETYWARKKFPKEK